MKILLIDPPNDTYGKFGKIGGKIISLGLGYIAGTAIERGDSVEILDMTINNTTDEELACKIKQYKPDVLGITATIMTIDEVNKVAKISKNAHPLSMVVLGGSHPSLYPEQTLLENDSIDFLVLGEGEITFRELLDAAEKNTDYARVKGIAFRKKRELIKTLPQSEICNLDNLPKIPYRLFPMARYRPQPMYYRKLPVYTLVTSRGCPFRCAFCPKPVFGSKYRAQSPDTVIREVEFLVREYGAREIIFYDDTFFLRRERVVNICNMLIERKLNISWNASTRIDLIDYDLLKIMKKSGCWQLVFGLESGNQELLDVIQKGITIKQIEEGVRDCRRTGIVTRGSFMLGLPGETPEMARKTIDFAIKLDLDYANFCITVPHYNTKLFDICRRFGIFRNDVTWKDFNLLNFEKPIFLNYNISAAEMKKIYRSAWRKFYFRPKYLIRQFARLRHITDIIRNLSGLKALLKI